MEKMLSAMLGKSDLSEFGVKEVNGMNQNKRLPAVMLIDTSGSMRGTEELLKSSVEKLYDEILSDRTASSATELSVMTFNSDIEILEKMREIKYQEAKGRNLEFHCDGLTLTGLAMKAAISQIEARKKVYTESKPKIKYYAPIIFFISDGHPECYDEKVKKAEDEAMQYCKNYIKQEVAENRLVVISVEVGNRCDHKLMQELTGLDNDNHVAKIESTDKIADFFRFTSSIIISSSKTGTKSLNNVSFGEVK